ncbi:hypothetical protein PC116_g10978 [Phytophthora cactorum]|uniref:Uncharacterized protein n=2 Tax=Phytophthora cactorum TaxID=29920 RepID=A0A8T1KWA3_9STRA|nr:hypothetical protein PC111_g7567 [Phytophthora cactorum]KAG2902933.1 hypothetical protein PC114_g12491 [Phytophthora cactorum]KAG2936830.1 hypothetical protein PC117_g11950 [Phytophthora cactorum]KAG4241083.1 hypothetical protein PC116_g10978 [Phytophthora cactorum]
MFLGLVDMIVVNAYIVNRDVCEKKKNSHFDILAMLHKQLIEESEDSFTQTGKSSTQYGEAERPPAVREGDMLTQTTGIRLNSGVQRLRHRQCKMCSLYKPKTRRGVGLLAQLRYLLTVPPRAGDTLQ